MLFNSTVTLYRMSHDSIGTLKNSLAAHGDFYAAIRIIFLIAALLIALAAAADNGLLDMLFYQNKIPYGVPEMEEVNQFMAPVVPNN